MCNWHVADQRYYIAGKLTVNSGPSEHHNKQMPSSSPSSPTSWTHQPQHRLSKQRQRKSLAGTSVDFSGGFCFSTPPREARVSWAITKQPQDILQTALLLKKEASFSTQRHEEESVPDFGLPNIHTGLALCVLYHGHGLLEGLPDRGPGRIQHHQSGLVLVQPVEGLLHRLHRCGQLQGLCCAVVCGT